jgi:2-desacetyl-2-hydroxyethyl bacteriochlorophyllide A dehydrogenase
MTIHTNNRAVVISGPGRASLETVKVPTLDPEDILVKVAYEGVCATDLEILDCELGYYKSGMAKYPIVPGHEFSGEVVAMGGRFDHISEGDHVVVECIQSCGRCESCLRENWIGCEHRKEVGVIGQDGGYAEYVVFPGHFAHKLPDGFDLKKAALCEPVAVVLKGLTRLEKAWGGNSPKKCVVKGGGPLGHLCAKILSLRGNDVTVFDRIPSRRSYFEGTAIKSSEGQEKLDDYEVLIEVTGDPGALLDMLHSSCAGSTLLLLGLPYARREFSFENIVAYDKTIVGSVGSSAREFREAIKILPQLDLDHFTQNIFSLDDFAQAWEVCRAREHLKVLLEIGGA